jgi:hypothetical protein
MPYFDNAEERKAGPTRHTPEQLRVIACRHEVKIGRQWWHEQARLADEIQKQSALARGLWERLRRLALPCTQCGAIIVLRYTPKPGVRVVLVDDADLPQGEVVDEVGEVVDERDLAPPLPETGVIEESELPLRGRRR